MVKLEHTLVVNRPVAEVFAYLTEPASLPEWQAGVREARKESEGPLGTGSRITEVRKFLGKRIESTLQVTAYEPDRRFDLQVASGPIPFSISHTLEAEDGGTRITFVGEGEPGGFFKLAEPLVGRQAKRQAQADFETLKEILESRSG